jgi:hypothetical protein
MSHKYCSDRSSLLLTEHPELKQWVEGKTKLKDNQIHSELSKKQLSAIRKALKHPVYMIQGVSDYSAPVVKSLY